MNENSTKDPRRAEEGGLFDNWIDAIEDGVHSRVRGFIETMLEESFRKCLRVRATAGGQLARQAMGPPPLACATGIGSAT